MSYEDAIPTGQADFENTLTPEQAEEFDRMAAEQIAKQKAVVLTRDQWIAEGRAAVDHLDAYLVRLLSVPGHEHLIGPLQGGMNAIRNGMIHVFGVLSLRNEDLTVHKTRP
jgi:hypothetical protein